MTTSGDIVEKVAFEIFKSAFIPGSDEMDLREAWIRSPSPVRTAATRQAQAAIRAIEGETAKREKALLNVIAIAAETIDLADDMIARHSTPPEWGRAFKRFAQAREKANTAKIDATLTTGGEV